MIFYIATNGDLCYSHDMKKSHIMLDCETLATTPESVVLTIGAIRFNPFDDDTNSVDGDVIKMDTFYRRVDIDSFDWPEAHIDDSTVEWWSKQPTEAKEEAFAEDDRHDIRVVMQDFYKWANLGFEDMWANGTTFDIGIMETINRHISRGNVWRHWQISDARTVYKLVEHDRPNKKLHHALWDCWSQIVALQSCLRNLNITKFPPKR
jgi:3' exoribonuclease, RNase T-like